MRLSAAAGINTTAFIKNCKPSTCRTFFLPKGPPQYYPADRPFASALEALLRRGASGAAANSTREQPTHVEDSDSSPSPRRAHAHDSLADFGAGVGAYGHALLTLDPSIRYAGYDGAGNVEYVTSEFVRWFDLSLPLSLPKADWVLSLEVTGAVTHISWSRASRALHPNRLDHTSPSHLTVKCVPSLTGG